MTVRTTYFSALSHGKVTPGRDALVLGVVREPFDWVGDVVDRNVPVLAPPEELLSAYKRVEEAAERSEERNPREVAWRSVDFEQRYREYLSQSSVQQPLDTVRSHVEDRPVWLVCYEASERWCHRRLLVEHLLSDLGLPCHPDDHRLVVADGCAHARRCARCGFATQTLTDHFGQDLGEVDR